MSTEPPGVNRQTKRRARTRSALLGAARDLLAEGRSSASIDEITKRADVGFGSFFNHFPGGKDELFEQAVFELLDVYSAWIGEATADLDDPAEVFARSFRLTGRLALDEPGLLSPLLSRGNSILFVDQALRRRALEDLDAGLASGRFVAAPVAVHLVAVGSLLLGLVGLVQRRGEDGMPAIDEESVDATAAAALRALGLTPDDAAEVAARSLPVRPALSVTPAP